jgi:hypothetical protein
MDLQEIVESVLRDIPSTRANNDLVWAQVCEILCDLHGITTAEGFIHNTLNKNIPSSHTVAASISVVRKKYPELRPTDEQMARKEESKKQYINQYKNA